MLCRILCLKYKIIYEKVVWSGGPEAMQCTVNATRTVTAVQVHSTVLCIVCIQYMLLMTRVSRPKTAYRT